MKIENTIVADAEVLTEQTGAEDEDYTELDTENDEDVDPNEQEDLDYDDEGNVLIPDDEDAEEPEDESEPKAEEPAKKAEEPSDTEKLNEQIAERERQDAEFKRNAKAALKSLGVETDDVMDGLLKLAAEAEGVSKEEYFTRLRAANALAAQEQQNMEQLAKNDLDYLKTLYPSCKDFEKITDMPNAMEFAKYRDLGLPPEKAFAAANPNLIRGNEKTSKGSKEHLQTVVPKKSGGTASTMTSAELAEFRDLFPGKSDKELAALYKKTKLED